jgi:hypothetical protein
MIFIYSYRIREGETMNDQPTGKNLISVIIYKNGDPLKECSSIQEAARYLKEYTGDTNFRYAKIENGLTFGDLWQFNGSTYTFRTDEKIRIVRYQHRQGKKR